MNNRPIHKNLDTSFVNLSALIKYLRRRQFVGSVNIQLNGYKADIELREDNQIKISEHDQISGRISTGEEALQRLLIRAREPGGTINVYQLIEEEIVIEEEPEKPVKLEKPQKQEIKEPEPIKETEPIIEAKIIEPIPKPTQEIVSQNGILTNGKAKASKPKIKLPKNNPFEKEKKGEKPQAKKPLKKEKTLPDFPFSLTNKVEEKARNTNEISDEDWQILLKLTVEMLGVIDKSLALEKLDFTAAFRKARTEIADDYPFLNPKAGKFDYANKRIKMTEKVNEKIFIASMIEAIRRILEKLESNPKFTEVHRKTTQTLIALLNKREKLYDKFSITPQLKRILGI